MWSVSSPAPLTSPIFFSFLFSLVLVKKVEEKKPATGMSSQRVNALKATYGAHLGTSSRSEPQLISYPQVGDPFKTIENFKEACLLASWSAGHDMVRIYPQMSSRLKLTVINPSITAC